MTDDTRLPTALWLDAHLRRLGQQGISYYITQTGAYASGVILLKIVNTAEKSCRLLTQQRNLDGQLVWMAALKQEIVEEKEADAYIQRATGRDPDLWVVEIEGRDGKNPFDDKQNTV